MDTYQKGFTLAELLIFITVLAIGVLLAMPSWQSAVHQRDMSSLAESVAAFISHAQRKAVQRGEQVTVTARRNSDGTQWCLGASNEKRLKAAGTDRCDCAQTDAGDRAYCAFDNVPQVIRNDQFDGPLMESAAVGGAPNDDIKFSFDPVLGVKLDEWGHAVNQSNELTFQSRNHRYLVQVDVAVTGRVRVCNPDSDRRVAGFFDCLTKETAP